MALSTGSFIRSSSVQSSHSHHNRSRKVSSSDPAMTSDPIATWSCYLKYAGIGGSVTGSGVIVEFNVPHTELQSCLPGLQKLSSPPETSYALLTCHHTLSGLQPTPQGGWWLYVGPGRRAAQKLSGLVCGIVSCCGENGIISCGSNRSSVHVPVLLSHKNECCKLRLDFTMLLLNQSFEKLVIKQGMHSPPLVHLPSLSFSDLSSPQALFSQIESDAASGMEERMQLYHREEADIAILPVEIDRRLSTTTVDDSHQRLKDEIATYKKYRRIYYTESEFSGGVVEGYSGSALVYYNSDTEETRLVGIHVGVATEEERLDSHTTECKWYIGVSIYGILQLLSGQPAAFFAVMEHHSARRMWPFRWAHLISHKLETCKPEHLPLGYLVEMLHHMLEKSKGSRLIQPDFRDLPENVLAALRVLIAVFKCFEISGHADVAAAICNKDGVFAGDEREIKLFRDNVTELSKSFPDLLINVFKGTDDEEMAKACSECYNMMLNFKYEGIVQGVLHTGDSIAYLGQLRQRYRSPEILGSFIDILLKCRLIMETKHAETTAEDSKEHEAQLQQQKEKYDTQIQQQAKQIEDQKEKFQTDLIRKMDELEGLQRRSADEQLQKACLELDIQKLQEEKRALQQQVERLKQEKRDAAAATEKHRHEAAATRESLKQVREEKQELEGKIQKSQEIAEYMDKQQKQHREKIENELKETRQKAQKFHQQLTVSKAENEQLHRQLGEMIN